MFRKLTLIFVLSITPVAFCESAGGIPNPSTVSSETAQPVVAVSTTKTVQTPAGVQTTNTTVTTQAWYVTVAANILSIFQAVITTLAITVATLAFGAVARHFNIQTTVAQQDMVRDAATSAVAKTEAWADAHKDAPSSNDKLNYAIKAIRVIADNSTVKTFTNDQLSHYVEEAVYKMFNQTDPSDTPAPVAIATVPKVV